MDNTEELQTTGQDFYTPQEIEAIVQERIAEIDSNSELDDFAKHYSKRRIVAEMQNIDFKGDVYSKEAQDYFITLIADPINLMYQLKLQFEQDAYEREVFIKELKKEIKKNPTEQSKEKLKEIEASLKRAKKLSQLIETPEIYDIATNLYQEQIKSVLDPDDILVVASMDRLRDKFDVMSTNLIDHLSVVMKDKVDS